LKIRTLFILSLLALTCFPQAVSAGPAAAPEGSVATRSTASLKKYMAKFGAMFAGLEIIKLKEKKPDWEAIDLTLQDMSSTLGEMQKADADKRYKEYTDVLAAALSDMKMQSQKRDKKIFESIDKLGESCFRCHAAHRPSDYILPKKDKRITGD